MKSYNKLNLALVAVVALAMIATGCDNKQIAEANKLVESANKKLIDAKALEDKAVASFRKINGDTEDLDESKTANEAELKQLAANFDQAIEFYKGAASDYGGASKLSQDATFKAYYDVSGKDAENSAARVNQLKAIVQAFVDSKTFEEYSKRIGEIQSKSEALKKEAEDTSGKLKKLEAEVNAKNKK